MTTSQDPDRFVWTEESISGLECLTLGRSMIVQRTTGDDFEGIGKPVVVTPHDIARCQPTSKRKMPCNYNAYDPKTGELLVKVGDLSYIIIQIRQLNSNSLMWKPLSRFTRNGETIAQGPHYQNDDLGTLFKLRK